MNPTMTLADEIENADATCLDLALSKRVFEELGYETTVNKRGYQMRVVGEAHWWALPRCLVDFKDALRYTIETQPCRRDRKPEIGYYIDEMKETAIGRWSVFVDHATRHHGYATANTPAAALVAAWLRTRRTP